MSRIASKSGFSGMVRVVVVVAVGAVLLLGGCTSAYLDARAAAKIVKLGEVCEKEGNIDCAIEHYESALKTNSSDSSSIVRIIALREAKGDDCLKAGNFDCAISNYESIYSRMPSNRYDGGSIAEYECERFSWCRYGGFVVYGRMKWKISNAQKEKDGAEMKRLAEEAITNPDKAIAHYTRVIQQDKNGATWLEIKRRSIGLGPYMNLKPSSQTVQAYYQRGLAYLNKGDSKAARADFNTVLEIEPKHRGAEEQIYGKGQTRESANQSRIAELDANFKNNPQGWTKIKMEVKDGKEVYTASSSSHTAAVRDIVRDINKDYLPVLELDRMVDVSDVPGVKAMYQKQEREKAQQRQQRDRERQDWISKQRPVGQCRFCGRLVYAEPQGWTMGGGLTTDLNNAFGDDCNPSPNKKHILR